MLIDPPFQIIGAEVFWEISFRSKSSIIFLLGVLAIGIVSYVYTTGYFQSLLSFQVLGKRGRSLVVD